MFPFQLLKWIDNQSKGFEDMTRMIVITQTDNMQRLGVIEK